MVGTPLNFHQSPYGGMTTHIHHDNISHGYVPLVISTSGPFLIHDLSPVFVTRVTRGMRQIEQELLVLH
jgi:hypothetical protein